MNREAWLDKNGWGEKIIVGRWILPLREIGKKHVKGWSSRRIAEHLSAKNVECWGKSWSHQLVASVLSSETYYEYFIRAGGLLGKPRPTPVSGWESQWMDDVDQPWKYDPALSECDESVQDWAQARQMKKARPGRPRKSAWTPLVLKGISCGCCAGPLRIIEHAKHGKKKRSNSLDRVPEGAPEEEQKKEPLKPHYVECVDCAYKMKIAARWRADQLLACVRAVRVESGSAPREMRGAVNWGGKGEPHRLRLWLQPRNAARVLETGTQREQREKAEQEESAMPEARQWKIWKQAESAKEREWRFEQELRQKDARKLTDAEVAEEIAGEIDAEYADYSAAQVYPDSSF